MLNISIVRFIINKSKVLSNQNTEKLLNSIQAREIFWKIPLNNKRLFTTDVLNILSNSIR